ncbi:MAG TPA: GspH/FimT family pseudopilin [Steroidobacteraceae bacterium]|nr:GspH/FimT family pseudopilin [Steroidobacteraceae bacterium]
MKHATRGFTLIELMTAILVLGILLGFAVPSYREMTRNNRIAAAQNDFVAALALARSEALRRGRTVSICPSTDGTGCATAADWKSGWIVFEDADGTLGTVDTKDVVLQKWGALAGETTFTTTATSLTYAPTGMQTPIGTKTFKVSAASCIGSKARLVSVGPIGSVTTTAATCP